MRGVGGGEPRILFGIGATKAGTSWLHRWLETHPECRLRTVKELHVFDTLEEGAPRHRANGLRKLRDEFAAKGAREERLRDLDELADLLMKGAPREAYLAYIRAGRGEAKVVGDITPAYALLPAARLRDLAGFGDTRFIYILRDPVERLWSHVRMMAGRREPDGSVTPERADRILNRTFRGEESAIERRSDYRGALQRMEAGVPEHRRLLVFFEDLFGGPASERICDFLGIARVPPLAKVVHGGQPLEMTDAQRRAARDWLDDQYRFVEGLFGRVPPEWAHAERV